MAGSEDASGVKDLLVDNFVSDVIVDGLVGADPVLKFINADSATGSEPVAVFSLKLAVD